MTQHLAIATSPDSLLISERDPAASAEPLSGIAPRARFVLLVDVTGERLGWMSEAVGGGHACLAARTKEEAIFLMQSRGVDLVLAGSEVCTPDFLSAVAARGLSRSCVFLSSGDEVERLSDAYAAQHTFRVLSSDHSAEAVRAFVQSVLYPREEARRPLSGVIAELTPAGRESVPCTLLDLSNRGFAVRVEAQHELLLPGTRITRVALYRDRDRLLDEVSAVVRYVEMLAPGAGGEVAYKVGLELRPPAAPQADAASIVLTEASRILSVLREGLPRGALTVAMADARHLVALSRVAAVDAKAREIQVEGAAQLELEPGDVVECRFEFAGASYSFLTSVTRATHERASGFALRIPRALRTMRQRRSIRVRPHPDSPVTIAPSCPFTGRFRPRKALNITASGAAFSIAAHDELLPIGTRLSHVSLRFPDGTELSCRAAVRTLVPGPGVSEMCCGVEFIGLTKTEQARIADAIVHAGRPELRDGTGTPFGDLWNFFLDTRFLYPEKLASMNVGAVKQTMIRLLGEPNDILKTSLFVKDGRIEGHLSGVRAYRRTWIMQHLAARVSGKSTMTRGRLLNLAVIEYLEQLPDIEWIKLWYRPTNRWPARVFGGYAKKLADPSLSHHTTYSYLVSKTDAPLEADPAVTVRPAVSADHPRIESHFVMTRNPVLLRSDDLTSRDLLLPELSTSYGALGLVRRREALVAERDGNFAGFALLEVSSPGLNFSELTNTFRVFAPDSDAPAMRALVARARARYRELGFERAVGLAGTEEREAFLSHGFEAVKEYSCWTWHRSQYQGLFQHMLKLRL